MEKGLVKEGVLKLVGLLHVPGDMDLEHTPEQSIVSQWLRLYERRVKRHIRSYCSEDWVVCVTVATAGFHIVYYFISAAAS